MGAFKLSKLGTNADLIDSVSLRMTELTGVQLGDKQRALVEGRLTKRLRDLHLDDLQDYAKYLVENEDLEMKELISLLTTHHTYFFREFSHFEFLLKETLPSLIVEKRKSGDKTIRIWSAACSRGQEVYSLAMYLRRFLPQLAPDFTFEILGTDIDPQSVAIAQNGVYSWSEVKTVPAVYLEGQWAKGTGDIAEFVKVKNDLKKHCRFQVANLLNFDKDIDRKAFDVIFCRNVFIYFDAPAIRSITEGFLRRLAPKGQIFIGLSESLNGLKLPVEWIGPSVYAAPAAAPAVAPAVVTALRPVIADVVKPAPLLRVLCVDDSPTVLMLLKKMLTKEAGFEIVGTAGNGLQAFEKMRELKPDLMTLDIHMPEQNGLEYLKARMAPGHPPVLVVSSVSREDATLAQACLKAGAIDYVEKPSLETFTQRSEEIRSKLKSAVALKSVKHELEFKTDSTQMTDLKNKLRLVIAPYEDQSRVFDVLRGVTGAQPATLVVFEDAPLTLTESVTAAGARGLTNVSPYRNLVSDGQIALAKASDISFANFSWPATVSFVVVGEISAAMATALSTVVSRGHLILEDRASTGKSPLYHKAQQVVPLTSFAYESMKYLAREKDRK